MTGNLTKIWQKASQSSLPRLLFVVLSLVLAYQLAQLTWNWLSPPWQGRVYLAPVTSAEQDISHPALDITSITRYHLFGEPQKQIVEAPKEIKAPETKLQLELRGVISTGDTYGAAIIADASKNESYYRVGDSLPGNVLLHEVHKDRVILDRGGLYETLSLPVEKGAEGLIPQDKAPGFPSGGLAGANMMPGTNPETISLLQEYRQTLQNDPQQLMGLLRTFPVKRGDQLVGYRIAPGRDRTLLSKFGLRPGDIVTSVNGITLDSPANGLMVMQKLNSAESLSLEVERNGSKQFFEFSLN